MLMYWSMVLFKALGRMLPEKWLRGAAHLLGHLVYLALPKKRASMQRNLEVMLRADPKLAEAQRRRQVRTMARQSMIAYCHTLLDFLLMTRLLPKVIADIESSPGIDQLHTALNSGRGAVLVTAHFGHWDLAGAAIAPRFPSGRLYAVVEEFAHAKLNERVILERQKYGIQSVPMSDVRQMVRILRGGNILILLADRPVQENDGVSVRFFGQQAQIPAGAAILAGLARCQILVGYLRQTVDGRFEGAILPPIEPVRTGNREADTTETMQRVANALEHIIQRSPHQWYMFRDMWSAPRVAERVVTLSTRMRVGATLVATVWAIKQGMHIVASKDDPAALTPGGDSSDMVGGQ